MRLIVGFKPCDAEPPQRFAVTGGRRGDERGPGAFGVQPHPPFEDRAARTAGATVERVAVLIDFDDDGGVIVSGCGLVPLLLRHLGEGAADRFDVAVFVE